MTNDIYALFDHWLKEDLGIRRNYAANLKSLNTHVISKLTGTSYFLEDLYEHVYSNGYSDKVTYVCNLLGAALKLKGKYNLDKIELSKGTFADCLSAFRKYCWFLRAVQPSTYLSNNTHSTFNSANIIWSDNPRKELGADFRLKTQSRLNQDENKKANFPSKLIDQIANNASKWADNCGLSSDHPSRLLKDQKEKWLDNLVNKIIFLIEDGKQVRFEDIDKIGTQKIPTGGFHVYLMMKNSGTIHQVLTRKKNGSRELMVLPDEKLSNIAIDHVYRMEDLLLDLQDAFPFLKKLTALIRSTQIGDLRSKERTQAVRQYIEDHFKDEYADDMKQLIKELHIMENVITLEAITKKNNLDKH